MKYLNPYDFQIIDKLSHIGKPYAHRVAQILRDPAIEKIQGYRAMAEAVISLEAIKDSLFEELVEYKTRYGCLK